MIYERKGRTGVSLEVAAVDEDAAADLRLKLDRKGLAGMSITFTDAEWDEMVAAVEAHRNG